MRSLFLPKTTRLYKVNIIVVPCKISHMSCVLHANTFGYFTAAVLKLCWSRFESAAHSLLALWCSAIAYGWAMLISERGNLPKSCSCLSTLTLSRCFSSHPHDPTLVNHYKNTAWSYINSVIYTCSLGWCSLPSVTKLEQLAHYMCVG